jgi:predicted RNA binding protein YcfA (HicA-like mRNA interferase family)
MTARELMQILRSLGCEERAAKGAHVRFSIGGRNTTVSVHKGHDIPRGTLRGIERDLEPVLGPGWLRKYLR